jgi:hypothetical protein
MLQETETVRKTVKKITVGWSPSLAGPYERKKEAMAAFQQALALRGIRPSSSWVSSRTMPSDKRYEPRIEQEKNWRVHVGDTEFELGGSVLAREEESLRNLCVYLTQTHGIPANLILTSTNKHRPAFLISHAHNVWVDYGGLGWLDPDNEDTESKCWEPHFISVSYQKDEYTPTYEGIVQIEISAVAISSDKATMDISVTTSANPEILKSPAIDLHVGTLTKLFDDAGRVMGWDKGNFFAYCHSTMRATKEQECDVDYIFEGRKEDEEE